MKKRSLLILGLIATSLISCESGPSLSISSSSSIEESSSSSVAESSSIEESSSIIASSSESSAEVSSSSESSSLIESSSEVSSSESSINHYDEDGNYMMDEKYKSYYTAVDMTLTGNSLRTSLNSTISTHKAYSYDALPGIMKTTDRDWTLSPNKSDSDPYMRIIYASYNFNATTAQKYSTINTVWDKEHIWCKSKGGSFGTTTGVGSDLHHLRASDKPNNNNHRSSRNFGNVTNGTVGTDYLKMASGIYSGGTIDGIYEPVYQDKGDVARACFYMYVTYPSYCTSFSNSAVGSGKSMGILKDLLEWNKLDPVDEFEMHRNDLIYDDYQHNRNPFIDYPALADQMLK